MIALVQPGLTAMRFEAARPFIRLREKMDKLHISEVGNICPIHRL